jgi:hypothetical protein
VPDSGRATGSDWFSRKRWCIAGALLLGALPLWALPLMAAGGHGFLAYLELSHTYYGAARKLFGAALFPAHEFGIVPNGAAALVLAAIVYGILGAAAGWALAAGLTWLRSKQTQSPRP